MQRLNRMAWRWQIRAWAGRYGTSSTYDTETKNCFPVLRQRDASDAAPTRLGDLVQGFDPETPAASILQWASANGILDD